MMDFYDIFAKKHGNQAKQDYTIEPDFKYDSKDIVIKGGALYGYWYDGLWRTNRIQLINIIDKQVMDFMKDFRSKHQDAVVSSKLMNNHSSNLMSKFREYTKNTPDSEVEFNQRIIFSNETPVREDYSTSQLTYTPSLGETPSFDEMFKKLYKPDELNKILWFMGAVLENRMHRIEKFLFLYGGKGSGKGTILKVFKMLFDGYIENIDLQKLTSGSEFSTSGVKETQLLIDDDADLYSIKDDTNLLKLTSHDPIIVNNKYQSTYSVTFRGLLVAASNQRFRIRNIDSGITRRAVVAEPTDEKHEYYKYNELMDKIPFELPHIAQKAIDIFNELGEAYYQDYVPYDMMESTDLFYSFMRENAVALGNQCTLKTASELYKLYLEDFGYDIGGYKKKVKNELKRYYTTYIEQKKIDGGNVKNVYEGLKWEDIFPDDLTNPVFYGDKEIDRQSLIDEYALKEQQSALDEIAATYPAQYTTKEGTPVNAWDEVTTTLSDINTRELHYVRVPENHIVIDFDVKDKEGNKDLKLSLIEARKFPDTYMELSRSGEGLHMHYIYDGEVGKLDSHYSEDIEIKVYRGKSSLRRMLTLNNDLDIRTISTGLPEKEETLDMYKDIQIISWNENKMRTAIKGNLEKKYHDSTKPSVDFIVKIFDDAVKEGVKYDLRDMRQDILSFASSSNNQSKYCIGAVSKIKYSTIESEDSDEIQRKAGSNIIDNEDLYFYDVEVFSNLFIVAYKRYGDDEVTKWINPTREQIVSLVEKPLIGFNNRRYDNHILYAALLGEDNLSLYRQSQRIIHDKNAGSGMYSGAYELSYTDIYDYCNAGNKKSLKKWEVELGITHDEFELPWDQPVPEDMWERAAEYCGNDVLATEATFIKTQSDYNARRILSTLSGLSMNSTTNQHTTAIIFEGDPKHKTDKELVYTDLSKEFPGYSYSFGKSNYKDEDPGEGGYVYAEPGVYEDVALLDVSAMHPTSAIEMNAFGKYTQNFADILEARIHIKYGEYDKARKLFDGKLAPFLEDESSAKDLSNGLKTAINSVYGLTSAGFDTAFKHKDNVDNMIAKRGALFMIDLKHAVQEQDYSVMHIKTDSIKIPNADEHIINFVTEFGKEYGYSFDHEATYSKLALVNKSTYVSKDAETGEWEATGAQFKESYVFKVLFTEEEILPKDFFITKEVKNASIHVGGEFVGRIAELYSSKTGEDVRRITEDKEGYVSGTKGHKWKLSKDFTDREDIDMEYYNGLVEKAVSAIEKVGDIDVLLDRPVPIVEEIFNKGNQLEYDQELREKIAYDKVLVDGVEVQEKDIPFPSFKDDPFREENHKVDGDVTYIRHDDKWVPITEDDLPF